MASELVEEVRRNCSLLCLDVPEGTEFGIDYGSWSVGPKFKGVKLIPPGVHYVYYSASDKLGNVAPKTSFFLCLQPGEIVVRRWNPQTEDLDELDNEEADRFASSVAKFEFDQYLGVYPKERLSEWLTLSKHVTPSIVSILEPVGKKIFSLYESLDPKEKELLDTSLKNREFKKVIEAKIMTDEQQQKMNPEKTKVTYGRTPYYSAIPSKKSVPKHGKTAADITMHHFDKSPILEDIIKRYKSDEMGVIGELQFAFICFLFGQDFEGFEHWKNLLSALCSCDDALYKYPNLFVEFIKSLSFQLKQIPEDFFTDIISSQNFLLATLKGFFELLNDDKLDILLVNEARKLHEEVERRFGKVFSPDPMYIDEFDEDAPVVVELNE